MDFFPLVKEVLFSILKLFKNKQHIRPSNVFSDSLVIDHIAQEVLYHSDLAIDCFFVFLAHNGGKKLNPASLMYRSIVAGDFNPMQMRNFRLENYINLSLEPSFKALLSEVVSEKESYRSRVSGEYWNDKYRFEGLHLVRYYYLKYSKGDGLYYIMLGTTQEGENLNDGFHKQKIHFAVNKIRNIIKKY